jgi:hypothetical protein
VATDQLHRHPILVTRLLCSIEITITNHAVAPIILFLAGIKCHQLLLIHAFLDACVVGYAGLDLELDLIGKPSLGHELAIPFT